MEARHGLEDLTMSCAAPTLVTRSVRSGTATVVSMSGTLDRAAGAMVAAYLLDQADAATGDFHVDLRAVDLVDDAEVVLVTALRRRLAVRGYQLFLATGTTTSSAAELTGVPLRADVVPHTHPMRRGGDM